jgi:hypothetical protein
MIFNAFSGPLKIYVFYEVQRFYSPKELKYLNSDVIKVSTRLGQQLLLESFFYKFKNWATLH